VLPIVLAQERVEDARAGELLLVEKYYVDATRQVLGGALAPDANGTLRITYATVYTRILNNDPHLYLAYLKQKQAEVAAAARHG
jgi:hypothetical protein